MRLSALLVSTGISLLAATPAMAQSTNAPGADVPTTSQNPTGTPGAPPAIDQPGEAATNEGGGGNLADIVVTAQKRTENLQDVPIAVTALSSATIAQAGLGASEDLPRLTPGLTVNRNANFVGLYLRGVGTQYANPGLESSVAVYLDDTYLPRTGSAVFSFNDIDRIEVLKGPQGTLFGRNAAAGVVRIVTKDPVIGRWEGKASIQFGEFERAGADGVINVPVGSTAALRVATMYDSNNGYVDSLAPGTPRLQDRNVWHVNAKFLWEPADGLTVKLAGDIGRKLDHEGQAFISLDQTCPTQIAVCLGGTPGFGYRTTGQDYPNSQNFPGSKFDSQDHGASLRVDLDTGIGVLSSITTYRFYKFTGAADLDTTDIPFEHALTNGERTYNYAQEVQLVSKRASALQYALGFYYYREKARGNFSVGGAAINQQLGLPFAATSGSLLDQPRLNARTMIDIEAYAPYAQATYKLFDKIGITLGGRYTYEVKKQPFQDLLVVIPQLGVETSAFGGAFGPREFKGRKFTPKATIDFSPRKGMLFYGGWSRGFKSGGINTPDFARSPVVKPEVLDSYEIGAKTEFGNFRLNAAAFYYDYKNLQVQITDLRCGGSCVQNAANARIKGAEADATWAPTSSLEFGVGANYLDTKFTDFTTGQTFVPAFTTAACATASATADPADDAACLGYATQVKDQSGNRLPQAPTFSGYVRGAYTYEFGNGAKLRLNALFNHTSSYTYGPDRSFGVERPKDLLSGALTFITIDNFSLSVFGDNLLDEKYNTQFARQQTGGWSVPGAPRTWGVRLAKEFH